MGTKRPTKVQIVTGLEPEQAAAIDRIAVKLRASRSTVIRQAVDLFLAHNIDNDAAESTSSYHDKR